MEKVKEKNFGGGGVEGYRPYFIPIQKMVLYETFNVSISKS